MTILREGADTGIGTRAMARPNRRAGELLACTLLHPAFERAFRDRYALPTASMERATREFGADSVAPLLCGYAVHAMARPDLALLAMRQQGGRSAISAAIDCLEGSAAIDRLRASEEKP